MRIVVVEYHKARDLIKQHGYTEVGRVSKKGITYLILEKKPTEIRPAEGKLLGAIFGRPKGG